MLGLGFGGLTGMNEILPKCICDPLFFVDTSDNLIGMETLYVPYFQEEQQNISSFISNTNL